jgi:hypothetical protein
MDINEVQNIIIETEKKIANLKEMIVDLNTCKNEMSQSILLAAISKYANQLKLQQAIR